MAVIYYVVISTLFLEICGIMILEEYVLSRWSYFHMLIVIYHVMLFDVATEPEMSRFTLQV